MVEGSTEFSTVARKLMQSFKNILSIWFTNTNTNHSKCTATAKGLWLHYELAHNWLGLTQIEFQGDLESRELDFLRKFACHWIWWLGGKLFDLYFFFMRTIYMSKPVKKCLLIITKSSETTIFPFLQSAWIHRFLFNFILQQPDLCGTFDTILTMRLVLSLVYTNKNE